MRSVNRDGFIVHLAIIWKIKNGRGISPQPLRIYRQHRTIFVRYCLYFRFYKTRYYILLVFSENMLQQSETCSVIMLCPVSSSLYILISAISIS